VKQKPKTLTIDWSKAQRQLDALENVHQKRVRENVKRFAEHGQGDVLKMAGSANPVEWRLKFKPWRVIFAISDHGVMHVLSIAQRKDAY
jgi:mRNA-degrading endonuclease RelE of RelBE toxin-antitoxin system